MKLHLACGTVYLDGWVNVDVEGVMADSEEGQRLVEANQTTKEKYYKDKVKRTDFMSGRLHDKGKVVDMIADITDLPEELTNVDYILAVQVIEHFSKKEAEQVLEDWVSRLALGGVLEIDIPDLTGTIEVFNDYKAFGDEDDLNWFLRLMYGSQKNEYSLHKWMYTKESATKVFEKLGLKHIEVLPNIHTYPAFAIRGTK